jgi:hypothetical protein
MWVRQVAGWTVIAAGSGLAAISGVLAYHGFEAMISIPFAGWIGPCVAASLIGLGIAVESEIRARRWLGAAVLGALLVGAGLLDRHSGELALAEKVNAAAQADADRLAAYSTAETALADAKALAARLEGELAVMTGADTRAAQQLLGVIVDGKRGTDTVAAMQTYAADIRPQLAAAREDVRNHTETVATGKPASTAPFSLHDASLYASLITLLSIVLAFAGSYIAHGLGRDVLKELDEVEEGLETFEAEVFDLAEWMKARSAA